MVKKYEILTIILIMIFTISSFAIYELQHSSDDMTTAEISYQKDEFDDIESYPENIELYSDNIAIDQFTNKDSFISVWDTSLTSEGSSSASQIKLPLISSGSYNFVIDWGDQTSDTITTFDQAEVTHTYSSSGTYTLNITGQLDGWRFDNAGDKLKIVELTQWGNMSLGNEGAYFHGAGNMVLSATDAPDLTSTTNMSYAFKSAINLGSQGGMSSWNVSSVIDMSAMFYEAIYFNQPLDTWNVSSVTDMSFMFYNSLFNQPLNSWDVSNVIDMSSMFTYSTFNQPLNSWNVSSVIDMSSMFYEAVYFSQPLDTWNVSNVMDMSAMFNSAYSFNQPLNSWNVSNVIDMSGMFAYATSFNQSLNEWDVSSVTNMFGMFSYATSFNQDISAWNVSKVGNMLFMFGPNKLSTNNYDKLLIEWAKLPLQTGVTFTTGGAIYSSGAKEARQYIIDTFSWTIRDGGLFDVAPVINSPEDMTYTLGDTGVEIIWNAQDDNPDHFQVTKNGSDYLSNESWNSGPITVNIEGLPIGTYNFTIQLFDTGGNSAIDTVFVTVIPTNSDGDNGTSPNNGTEQPAGINFGSFTLFTLFVSILTVKRKRKNN